jgi:hypothetical protein
LLAAGQAARDPAQLREAIDTFRTALALDAARPAWETIRRFRPAEREQIEARIRQAQRDLSADDG